MGAAAKLKAGAEQAAGQIKLKRLQNSSGAAQLAGSADIILPCLHHWWHYLNIKNDSCAKMYVSMLANKPDTAEKLFMAAQAVVILQKFSINRSPPTPEQQAAAETHAKTQWMTSVVTL